MILSMVVRILVLGAMPVIHAGVSATFGVIFGSSPLSAIVQGAVVLTLLSSAAWADLCRESSSIAKDEAEFLVREICVFALPFVCSTVWAVVPLALGFVPALSSFVAPFLAGLMLGRAAMEYHYFSRGDEARPFGPESVFYHHDEGE